MSASLSPGSCTYVEIIYNFFSVIKRWEVYFNPSDHKVKRQEIEMNSCQWVRSQFLLPSQTMCRNLHVKCHGVKGSPHFNMLSPSFNATNWQTYYLIKLINKGLASLHRIFGVFHIIIFVSSVWYQNPRVGYSCKTDRRKLWKSSEKLLKGMGESLKKTSLLQLRWNPYH